MLIVHEHGTKNKHTPKSPLPFTVTFVQRGLVLRTKNKKQIYFNRCRMASYKTTPQATDTFND